MASISSGNVSVNGNGSGGNRVSAMDMELDDGPVPAKGKPIDEKTLEDYGFITGDLLSVSLFVPEPKPSNRGGGGPHANNGASTGAGGGGGGPAAPGFGRREGPQGPGRESNVERADAEGHWARGEALPPQNANAFRGPRGSFGRDEPRDRAGFGGGIGIRGAGRRSPGPDRERNGFGRKRSRSPEARDRRESWGRR
jgi:histone deacetylase complex subunit SAP18